MDVIGHPCSNSDVNLGFLGCISLYGQCKRHVRYILLQWRHNGRDGVSNHRRLDCLHNSLFRSRSKKTSKLYTTGLCEGNSPMTSSCLVICAGLIYEMYCCGYVSPVLKKDNLVWPRPVKSVSILWSVAFTMPARPVKFTRYCFTQWI